MTALYGCGLIPELSESVGTRGTLIPYDAHRHTGVTLPVKVSL